MTKSPFFVGVLGAVSWAAAIFIIRTSWAGAMLLLGAFVVVPMLLLLVATPDRHGRHPPTWIAAFAMALPAAFALAAAFRFAPSRLAGVLAFPWLGVTLLAAMFGARRTLERGVGPTEEACIDIGLLFLAVGGVWCVLCRGFARPLGFDNLVAILTAVHFHFAGFALSTLTGLAGRRLPFGAPKLVAFLVVTGVIALAVGIALARPLVEQIAGWTLATGGCFMAAVHLHLSTRRGRVGFRVLIALSGLCLAGALVLAALFAARHVLVVPWVMDLGNMQRYHGTLNALGFAMLATFAWASDPVGSRAAEPGVPFSALSARVRVGPDFFEKRGVAVFLKRAPQGLMDSLDEHKRDGFDTARVHPAIRAFYERTADHELVVVPKWSALFALPARIVAFFARAIGQLALPIAPETRPIAGRLVALDSDVDGRPSPRGWVRTYADGRAMYVAAYARHRHRGVSYMNIAMPVPLGNLSSILRMDPLPIGGDEELAVALTSKKPKHKPSDAGIWFVSRLFGAVRMPLDETIEVRPATRASTHLPGATLEARHEMWFFGMRYVTLEYWIRPIAGAIEAPVDSPITSDDTPGDPP